MGMILRIFILIAGTFWLACCQANAIVPNGQPLADGHHVFIRIVKTDPQGPELGRLEMYAGQPGEPMTLHARWDVCARSGDLGPKFREGDYQSPEGFYFVRPSQLNPNSSYHLSFNLGFPNAYDRYHGRTGSFLMVHGDCVSIGCYAMTDEGISDIYARVEEAFDHGQKFVRVHIFPFPMTDENLAVYSQSPHDDFWRNLKEGWDWFEINRQPPNVTVDDGRYLFSEN